LLAAELRRIDQRHCRYNVKDCLAQKASRETPCALACVNSAASSSGVKGTGTLTVIRNSMETFGQPERYLFGLAAISSSMLINSVG
jgi:hypothetical protein